MAVKLFPVPISINRENPELTPRSNVSRVAAQARRWCSKGAALIGKLIDGPPLRGPDIYAGHGYTFNDCPSEGPRPDAIYHGITEVLLSFDISFEMTSVWLRNYANSFDCASIS
jgi:hypothetical protein